MTYQPPMKNYDRRKEKQRREETTCLDRYIWIAVVIMVLCCFWHYTEERRFWMEYQAECDKNGC